MKKDILTNVCAVAFGAVLGLGGAYSACLFRDQKPAADIFEALNTDAVQDSDLSAQYLPATTEAGASVASNDADIFDEQPVYEFVGFSHVAYDPDISTYDTERFTEDDIELIAAVVIAEAESECEVGQRLVIDVILNRVDSPYFPDTVYDVVYQPYHFLGVWSDRFGRYKDDEMSELFIDICEMVREELQFRTDADVVFFTAGDYGDYGVPMFKIGEHYFSSYE